MRVDEEAILSSVCAHPDQDIDQILVDLPKTIDELNLAFEPHDQEAFDVNRHRSLAQCFDLERDRSAVRIGDDVRDRNIPREGRCDDVAPSEFGHDQMLADLSGRLLAKGPFHVTKSLPPLDAWQARVITQARPALLLKEVAVFRGAIPIFRDSIPVLA